MKNLLPLFVSSMLFSVTAVESQAALALVYSTNFNAPTYSDAGLIGQDGWAITGAVVTNPVTVANSATTGTVTLATSGQDVNRVFAPAITSGSVYVTSTINLLTAQATGDYFLHLGDGGASNFYARIYAKTSGAGYSLAMGTSSGTTVTYGAELPFGSATVLVRYDFVAGAANDTGAIFINPTTPDGSGDTPYVAATTVGTDAASISSINFRQGAAASAPTVTFDNLSVSIPVPETSSALLLCLSGLALARRRR